MQRIICVNRQDEGKILLNVTLDGPASLDLKLVGTDNEYAYLTKILSKNVTKLKAKTNRFSDGDWEAVLSWFLTRRKPRTLEVSNLDDVEMLATVEAGKQLTLILRQNISGITQRLAAIDLKASPDEDIDLFDWVVTSSDASVVTEQNAANLEQQLKVQESQIQRLKTQMDEFIHAKERHENEMLEKFRQLLNTKKLKIRDQQRLLASAKIDPGVAENIRDIRASHKPSTNRVSRPTKRKVDQKAPEEQPTVKEESEDEGLSDEENNRVSRGGSSKTETPQDSDAEMEDNESWYKGDERERDESRASKVHSDKVQDEDITESVQSKLLPTRQLPFGGPQSDSPSGTAQVNVADDDEETDDEL